MVKAEWVWLPELCGSSHTKEYNSYVVRYHYYRKHNIEGAFKMIGTKLYYNVNFIGRGVTEDKALEAEAAYYELIDLFKSDWALAKYLAHKYSDTKLSTWKNMLYTFRFKGNSEKYCNYLIESKGDIDD